MQETDGCVKFNRSSLHYKVTNYVFPFRLNEGISLCPYIRMVIASVFAFPFMVGWNRLPDRIRDQAGYFQAELIFLTLVVIMAGFLDFMDDYKGTDKLPIFSDMVLIGFFGGNAVGIIGGLILTGSWALKDYINSRPKTEHVTTGLLKAYVHAKHNRMCPCVEFED